ncbi:MAG: hypothetical protein V1922_01770 [bacterium]
MNDFGEQTRPGLKHSGITKARATASLVFALITASCAPEQIVTPVSIPPQPTKISETTKHVPTPTPHPDSFPGWKMETPTKIQDFISSSGKLSSPVGGKTFTMLQRDPQEYSADQRNNKAYTDMANNACGPADIAFLIRLYSYLKTGAIPVVKVGEIFNKLTQATYTLDGKQYSYFEPNDTMHVQAFYQAIGQMGAEYGLYKVNQITPVIRPGDQTNPKVTVDAQLVEKINKNVFARGGVITANVAKPYGVGGAVIGHYVVVTSMKWDEGQGDAFAEWFDPWLGKMVSGYFTKSASDYTDKTTGKVTKHAMGTFIGITP